ncbi:MAG TPA: hypothetical protein VFQ01_05210 [Nocardioides sp.]|jgi:hypothetical protein|nr:hypothetical protein [Nocardioides sp.]
MADNLFAALGFAVLFLGGLMALVFFLAWLERPLLRPAQRSRQVPTHGAAHRL